LPKKGIGVGQKQQRHYAESPRAKKEVATHYRNELCYDCVHFWQLRLFNARLKRSL